MNEALPCKIVVNFQCRVFDDYDEGDGYRRDGWVARDEAHAWELYRGLREAAATEETAREWYQEESPFSNGSGFLCCVWPPQREYAVPVEPLPLPPDLEEWQEPAWIAVACGD